MRIEVSGLAKTKANFNKLEEDVQRQIGRDALRFLGWQVAKPMREATYRTFTRRTGAIRQGLSVGVEQEPHDHRLRMWVVEHDQNIAGAATPFKLLARKRLNRKKRTKQTPTVYRAYWWRFLERGTRPRHKIATPKRPAKFRNKERFDKYIAARKRTRASPSRGGIPSKKWLQPTADAVMPSALQAFRDQFLRLVDAAISAMTTK